MAKRSRKLTGFAGRRNKEQLSLDSKSDLKHLRQYIAGGIALVTVVVGGAVATQWDNIEVTLGDILGIRSQQVITEADRVREQLRESLVIPVDEQVRIARVIDPDQLRTQDPVFYARAAIGQYIIVLEKSRKIILFDVDSDQIVNFSTYTTRPVSAAVSAD